MDLRGFYTTDVGFPVRWCLIPKFDLKRNSAMYKGDPTVIEMNDEMKHVLECSEL